MASKHEHLDNMISAIDASQAGKLNDPEVRRELKDHLGDEAVEAARQGAKETDFQRAYQLGFKVQQPKTDLDN